MAKKGKPKKPIFRPHVKDPGPKHRNPIFRNNHLVTFGTYSVETTDNKTWPVQVPWTTVQHHPITYFVQPETYVLAPRLHHNYAETPPTYITLANQPRLNAPQTTSESKTTTCLWPQTQGENGTTQKPC